MELLTYKDNFIEYTYYLNNNGKKVWHGDYMDHHINGRLWERRFHYHGTIHGERKRWNHNGEVLYHAFYVNGEEHPYVEMNAQEKLLFQIKHPGFRFIEG